MCGIPMMPTPDAVTGRRLTKEQALEHIGGAGAIISDHGWTLIHDNTEDYIWKYPDGKAWCTACHAELGDIRRRHNELTPCPACGKTVRFKHEARGHKTIFDEFYLYEWRKSRIDGESIALTCAHVWRDSRYPNPESAPLEVAPCAIYVFRPGKAATVYKGYIWEGAREEDIRQGLDLRWYRVDSVAPEHTKTGWMTEFVMDWRQFREAIEGTRIGRTFDLLNRESRRRDIPLELTAIANCARRPWLEYLHKVGQKELAGELMRYERISREIIPNQRARTPRELLGLTEAQWFEIRRDGVTLSADDLERLRMMRRMGLEKMKLRDMLSTVRKAHRWLLGELAPHRPGEKHWSDSVGDMLEAAGTPDKLKRKIYRRILADSGRAGEWRDYYDALRKLGEDMTDSALMLPRDMPAMHDRMTERLRATRDERKAQAMALKEAGFRERKLPALRKAYCFEACGLVLRPYETAKEILEEGRKLSICIGSYAERYLEGGTIICCLRRADKPDEPWRAVEFSAKSGALVQDRGYRNDWAAGPEAEKRLDEATKALLKEFWAAFEAWRKAKRRKTA